MQKITIIGSGNVATHLAKAFYSAGHQILQIWSREFDHAEQLASQVYAEPVNRLNLLYPTADVYILAVSDDALFDLALELKLRDALVLHTSGTVSMSVLRPISRHYGVLYAPQSFVRTVQMDYAQLPFCIEGSTPTETQQIAALAGTVSPHIHFLDSEQRRWIHLTSVMVNNFGNAINAIAQDLLNEKDIPFDILQPLIQVTAEKARLEQSEGKSLWRLQTGPAVRHDSKTIDRHRSMLKDNPQLLELYELLTSLIENHTLCKK